MLFYSLLPESYPLTQTESQFPGKVPRFHFPGAQEITQPTCQTQIPDLLLSLVENLQDKCWDSRTSIIWLPINQILRRSYKLLANISSFIQAFCWSKVIVSLQHGLIIIIQLYFSIFQQLNVYTGWYYRLQRWHKICEMYAGFSLILSLIKTVIHSINILCSATNLNSCKRE